MSTRPPDGITAEHQRGGRENPWPFLLLSVVLIIGITGLLGGFPSETRRVDSDAARLSVRMPDILRNGMFFEMVIEVTPRQPAQNLTIGVSDGLWREITINTMIPAADKEKYGEGFRQFSFGEVKAGETLSFKVDGQINPVLFLGTRGQVAAFDGERQLVAMPLTIEVLP